jgi:vacuolar-type H+-ATPase subunit H
MGSPSLIPVIERAEQQLRTEQKQVRHGAADQVSQAEKQAELHLQESRLSISELVEQRRKDGLAEMQEQAEQISRSSEERSAHLQQKAKKNMARAVQRVVEAVLGSPYGITAVGGQT